jgi:hypothetical protein
MRLQRLYDAAPRLGRQRAIDAFLEGSTAILTDQIVLGPELLGGEIGEPTDEEIRAFFDDYRGTAPGNTDSDAGGNPFGFGYLLPARVKLEWLALERGRSRRWSCPTRSRCAGVGSARTPTAATSTGPARRSRRRSARRRSTGFSPTRTR